MTIDELTHAAVLNPNMRIPISLFGQNMRISVSQLQSIGKNNVVIQFSEDGINWIDTFTEESVMIRISTDGGDTFAPSMPLNQGYRFITDAEIKGMCNNILK